MPEREPHDSAEEGDGTDEDRPADRPGVVGADADTTGPGDPDEQGDPNEQSDPNEQGDPDEQGDSVVLGEPLSASAGDGAADSVGGPAFWREWVIPRRGQLVVAVLLGGLAFAMTAQINQGEEEDFSSLRGVELVELLKSTDAANERLADQIEELGRTRDELESSTQRSETAERQARERADALAILAGAVGATGPGLTITIDGPEDEVGAAQLLDAIEELRDAGAEAFSINGAARVVAQTYFLDTENGRVSVGGRDVQRPFTIDAIGDPETMAEAVGIRGGLVDSIEFRGGTISVETKDSLSITALAELSRPEYSRPTSQPE